MEWRSTAGQFAFPVVAAAFVQLAAGAFAQETLLSYGSPGWHYRPGTSEASSPMEAWRFPGFPDSSWSVGAEPFYYGETLSGGTVVNGMRNVYSTLYLRAHFQVGNPTDIASLTLTANIDDGFVAWVNGVEVVRHNVPDGNLAYNAFASPPAAEPAVFTFPLTDFQNYLVPGDNVLAVHVVNVTLSSSDLVFDGQLTAEIVDDVAPTLVSYNPPAGSLGGLTQVAITFSEPVIGVEASDLLFNGAPAGSVSGNGATYTFTVSQTLFGAVAVSWDGSHAIQDLSGNRFDETAAGASWQYMIADMIAPTVVDVQPGPGQTVAQLSEIRVTFDEAVTGVDGADLLINGVRAGGVDGAGAGPYRFTFAQPSLGAVQVRWAADQGIHDVSPAGNGFAGGMWNYTLDTNVPAGLRINEVMALNQSGLADEDGDFEDWIELYNGSGSAVALSGWALSDERDEPGRWEFPAVTLPAGQYLMVFASGKDRRPAAPGGQLHTNFKLGSSGEFLGLFGPGEPRTLVSAFDPFPEQRADHSYGYDTANALRYFSSPTPGGANGNSSIAGVVSPVHFNVRRGFYDLPFDLTLSTSTLGTTIRFTTDGSPPSAGTGTAYVGPVHVSGTTVLRAAAFKSGLLPSTVGTHTYLFPQEVLHQSNTPAGYPSSWSGTAADYEMDPDVVNSPTYRDRVTRDMLSVPSLSVVCSRDDLFGANGIYIQTSGRGPAYERAASAEFIYPDGSKEMQVDAGLQLQGGSSRSTDKAPKHSFRLVFKGDFGPSTLSFPFLNDSPVKEFDTLVLDAGLNLTWIHPSSSQQIPAQYVRDQFVSDLQNAMGGLAPHGQFVHLYLNGIYWGMYDVHERPDESFAAHYLGGAKEEYDVVKNTEGFEVVNGNTTAWNTMMNLAAAGLANNSQYEQIQQYLDVPALIDYMIANIWAGNDDWPAHNWYGIRRRVPGGKFIFPNWDAEHVLKSLTINQTGVAGVGTPAGLYAQLRSNAEFRLLFADHIHRHFFDGGPLYVDPAHPAWDPTHPERNRPAALYLKRISEIDRAIVGESARWGDLRRANPYTRNGEWLTELNNLLSGYFPGRSAQVLNQFVTAGLYPTVSAPAFTQLGGTVVRNTALGINAPSGEVYYTTDGSDPRVYGSGAISPRAVLVGVRPITLVASVTIKARALDGGVWSALSEATYQVGEVREPLRVTEIMYHPVGANPYEFIELMNAGPVQLDVSGYRLAGVDFAFAPGTVLAPGAVVVLASAQSPTAFALRYPWVNVAGYFTGSLDNGGERVSLLDREGRMMLSVDYNDENGWPAVADGEGYSLEILDPLGDPDAPSNWRASLQVDGTPGAPPASPALGALRLNELMADNVSRVENHGTYPDWVELANNGGSAVNLGGWSLTDDGNSRQFVFPNPTLLPAGGFLVVWCDSETNTPGLHSGFKLDRGGDSVFLFDAETNRADAVTFGLQVTDLALGRVGGAWVLSVPTLGAANMAATLAPETGLRINEWLANSAPGQDDWLELFNGNLGLPAALRGVALTTSAGVSEIASLSFLAPGGHVRLWADERSGPDHLDFKLAAAGDTVTLFGQTGAPVDSIQFGPQNEGVSEGRLPDGSSSVMPFPGNATPGTTNSLPIYNGPLLNEVLVRNVAAVPNVHGDTPDWIELHNASSSAYDLGGMGLSVDGSGAAGWLFPPGTIIGGGGYLLVWCDDTRLPSVQAEAELNLGRSLAGNGGAVYLFNQTGQQVDAMAYGFQLTDRSIGRSGGTWRLLSTPTPGAANSAATTLGSVGGLRLNEWLAKDSADWFELYNPSALPVALSGLFLSDDPSLRGKTNTLVGPLSFIDAFGYVQWMADAKHASGADHTRFKLDGDGDALLLFDAGLGLIDAVFFSSQVMGVSQGRLPDGAGSIVSFVQPTPAAPNVLPGEDTDGDGLPDDWEDAHGLNKNDAADAGLDSDGDGMVNVDEYGAGTDPLDPASVLRIELEMQAGADLNWVQVRFWAQPGRSYLIEYASEAIPSAWKPLGIVEPEADLRLVGMNETQPLGAGQRFYRVRALPR